MTIRRVLPVIALAALAACASDEPGPLTGRYEGTCSSFFPGSPEVNGEPCAFRLDLLHTDRYVDGTSSTSRGSITSRSHVYGTLDGSTITACSWAEGGDSKRCVASWTVDVAGSGAPGTVLAGHLCNNFRTTVCMRFRVVKQ